MQQEVIFQNNKISYSTLGTGVPVILLHGYLMSSQIWKDFLTLLAMKYRVIAIDLPGHGNSSTYPPVHSMELMAEAVASVLRNERINQCRIIGHSMGGYVGLAFLEHYVQQIEKMVLLNTHPFDDSTQKINTRNRIIRLLKKNKKELLLKELFRDIIPPTENKSFDEDREAALSISLEQSTESLIATTNGLKLRPDRSFLLHNPEVPVKWIMSRADRQIDANDIASRAKKVSIIEPEIIEGGHMSFLERPYELFRLAHKFFTETPKQAPV
jgi:pimeloyl-ACP methyl ester carboxylesterase